MAEKEPEDFESILQHVYGKGHYLHLLFVLCSMTSLLGGLEIQSTVFMNYIPEHNCTDKRIPSANSTILWSSKFTNHTADVNMFQSNQSTEQCWTVLVNGSNEMKVPCSNWTYAVTPMKRTVVSQFNLVCDRQLWVPWLGSAYLLATALGFLIACVGDVIGRRKTFLAFLLLEIPSHLATPFASSIGMLLFLRCVRGLSNALSYLGINLISELVPLQRRAAYGNVYWVFWGVGYVSCAGIAYLTKDWVQMRLWMCTFSLFYLGFPFVLCESPRWLCLRGRPEEASRVLKRVAFWNGAQLSDEYFDKMDIFLQNESKKLQKNSPRIQNDSLNGLHSKIPVHEDSIRDLLTHRNLRLRCIIFCFVHSAITIVYFGLITNGSFVLQNIFLNVFLMGLTELPSSFLGWAVCVHCGRRMSLTLLLAITALCVGLTDLGGLLHMTVRAVVAISGKFFLSVAYCVSDLYIVELVPTSIRTSSFFVITTIAGLFSGLAPFINNMQKMVHFLPTILYCLISAIGALLVFVFMPETRDCPLAQTVYESEQLVRGKEQEWIEQMHQSRYGLITPGQTINVPESEETQLAV